MKMKMELLPPSTGQRERREMAGDTERPKEEEQAYHRMGRGEGEGFAHEKGKLFPGQADLANWKPGRRSCPADGRKTEHGSRAAGLIQVA